MTDVKIANTKSIRSGESLHREASAETGLFRSTFNGERHRGDRGSIMTHLLELAFAKANKVAPEEQDALAERIIVNLRDEDIWDQSFAKTTDEQWDRMADLVREEIKSGKMKDLGDIIR